MPFAATATLGISSPALCDSCALVQATLGFPLSNFASAAIPCLSFSPVIMSHDSTDKSLRASWSANHGNNAAVLEAPLSISASPVHVHREHRSSVAKTLFAWHSVFIVFHAE